MKILCLLVGLIACSLGFARHLNAQPYPSRVIRLVSPYAPGGGTDFLARTIGQKLTEVLGYGVVVDNRPGAGGIIGTESVAKAPPDGYTIMLASPSPIVVAPHLVKNLPYDPFKDLAPITLISIVPTIMAVHPSLPARTVREFIRLAKLKVGELTYSSSGNGGTGHLAGALFDLNAGTKMIHVPYRGTGPATSALIAGEVSLSFGETIALLPHVKSGRLRALAVTSLKRSSILPDLPAVAETIPGYTAGPWYGLLAPAKTPSEIIAKLNREVVNILRMPDIKASLTSVGAEPIGNTPSEFAMLLKEETERWGRVVREASIRIE